MSTHFLDKIILKKILDRFKIIKFYKYIYIYIYIWYQLKCSWTKRSYTEDKPYIRLGSMQQNWLRQLATLVARLSTWDMTSLGTKKTYIIRLCYCNWYRSNRKAWSWQEGLLVWLQVCTSFLLLHNTKILQNPRSLVLRIDSTNASWVSM